MKFRVNDVVHVVGQYTEMVEKLESECQELKRLGYPPRRVEEVENHLEAYRKALGGSFQVVQIDANTTKNPYGVLMPVSGRVLFYPAGCLERDRG